MDKPTTPSGTDKMKMYTIRDATTEKFFGRIFLFENDAHAIRVFKATVSNADDPMSQFPDDYTLYYVGEYDDDEGIPKGQDPRRVMTGNEAVKQRGIDLEKLAALHEEIEALKNGHDKEVSPGGTA